MSPTLQLVDAEELEAQFSRPLIGLDVIQLADEAKSVLGYSGLRTSVDQLVALPTQQGDLLAILREQGVQVFRPEDVAAYKAQEIENVMHGLRRRHKVAAWATLTLFLVSMALFAGACLGLNAWMTVAWSLITTSVSTAALAWFASERSRTRAHWRDNQLERYREKVPVSVLVLATRLKRYAPTLTFSVDEFQVSKLPRDPFLVVHLGEASFAIAVWNEARFDAPPID